jgi:hypothetical protein
MPYPGSCMLNGLVRPHDALFEHSAQRQRSSHAIGFMCKETARMFANCMLPLGSKLTTFVIGGLLKQHVKQRLRSRADTLWVCHQETLKRLAKRGSSL